jgi:hypothetical protein
MTERRFSDDEVAEIFRRATEASQSAANTLQPSEGLTLVQLQDIAKQVGIAPENLADAARSLERQEPRFRSQLLGMTVGVGRTVPLGRKITDEEWERLVVRLRDTFGARGKHRVDGSLREWTNGNLQILIEPTDDGDRLRMRTVNAAARMQLSLGVVMLTSAAAIGLVTATVDPTLLTERFNLLAPMVGGSVALFTVGLLRIRGWAGKRLQQMDEIAGRLSGETSRP